MHGYTDVALSLLSEVPASTGKVVDLRGAAPTPRLVTGHLAEVSFGQVFPFSGQVGEILLTTIMEFHQQVDAIVQYVVIEVPKQLLGAMSKSWMWTSTVPHPNLPE